MEHRSPHPWRRRRQLTLGTGRAYIYWIALFLLAVPSVYANEDTNGTLGMMTYPIAAESFNLGPITPAGAGEVLNFTYNASRPHAFEVVDHRLVMGVSMTHSVLQDSVGEWNITIYQDGIELNGCSYVFPTENVGGFLAGEFETYPPYGLSCIRTGATSLNNQDHTHTITVEFQVESGTPADIDNSFISFGIQRRDVYVIPDTLTIEPFDTWLPLGFLIIVFAFSAWQGYTLPLLISGVGVALEFFTTRPIEFVGIVFLLLIAFMLEYFVGGLRGLMKRRKEDDQNPW